MPVARIVKNPRLSTARTLNAGVVNWVVPHRWPSFFWRLLGNQLGVLSPEFADITMAFMLAVSQNISRFSQLGLVVSVECGAELGKFRSCVSP